MKTPDTDRPADDGPAASGATSNNDVAGKPPKKDGPLESIGKAISDPVKSAAEDEEPDEHGVPPVKPGG